ncbi:transmembrane protease serine 12 [Drosophila eugracilis]|uniref:transmembrane protease serine 12 n=1 Tax=Drosophila eugracilis TaxID=29029 RepID=UPI001BDA2223|nr:transmembrane protease serine 12 [Drosophila eugracilis]
MKSALIGILALLFLLFVPGLTQYIDGKCGFLPNGRVPNNISSPWMAYLHTTELLYVCGGTLITKNLVLTAAHCILSNQELVARLGEFIESENGDGTIRSEHLVNETFVHPFYNLLTNVNDIAILGLATDVVYSDYIRPICIPWWTYWRKYIDNIQVLTGARWGPTTKITESNAFRTEDIRRQPAEMCSTNDGTAISNTQFCAGDSESNFCNVDFSSPLGAVISFRNYSRFVLIGVATVTKTCNKPSVYTDILSHIQFILTVWRQFGKVQTTQTKSVPKQLPEEDNNRLFVLSEN